MASFPKRGLSKKDFDEKKKQHEQEKEAAKAFEEFVQTFDEQPATSKGKVWVKAGTFNAGTREETTKEKGQLYKPTSKFEVPERKQPSPELITRSRIELPSKLVRRKDGKKKSNLELFKEELKRIQEEREERHKLKEQIKEASSSGRVSRFDTPELPPITPSPLSLDVPNPYGSFDSGDPSTTNLYLGNLSPKLSEQRLMEIFGRYGPLASIKIMWPRNDEERLRGRNCGFVAFMTRRDAEAALEDLSGKDVEGYEMKLGWGKGVPIPPQPIYIPPALIEVSKPPPPSGLPFNAQPRKKDRDKLPMSDQLPEDPVAMRQFNKMLQRAVVKVVIPTERPKLMAIHRMLEFVVREGPLFEAMIMNKESDNELYSFLFDNQSAEHTYYRWKLFSILHGDSPQRWRTDEFRLFKGGSVWKPPPMNPYMMDRGDHKKPEPERQRNKLLTDSQRSKFESQLRHLTLERDAIAEAMVWCLEHADSAEEICKCITESLSNRDTHLTTKVARLYLVSDILHNCTVRVANASSFRKCFQEKLPEIFEGVQETYGIISSRLRAEAFKQRVMRVFRAWEDWAVYPQDFLINLQNTFLGFNKQKEGGAPGEDGDSSDVDGAPLSDSDDVDGVPLDGAALLKKARRQANDDDDDDDVDGVPLDEAGSSVDQGTAGALARAAEAAGRSAGGFIPSRWETVDPTDVAAGAVTTSKWEAVSAKSGAAQRQDDSDDDVDGVPLEEATPATASAQDEDSRSQTNTAPGSPDMDVSEERRVKLREVELKVVAYQDDLESGQRSVKTGYTLQEQVQHYRAKLMRKVERQLTDRKRRRERSPSSSEGESHQSYPSRRRSRSPRPDRSSDRSDRPRRRSRSHSPPRRRRRSKSPPSYRRSRSRSPAYRRSRSRSRSRSPSRKMRKKSKR